MRLVIFSCIIQQLLYFISEVESLNGQNAIPARKGEFPFIASLQYFPQGEQFCTGSLITTKHVVTAAHCMQDEEAEDVQIAFGIINPQSVSTKYRVASWLTFDGWVDNLRIKKESSFNDIAVVTLIYKVDEPNIIPIPLSKLNKQQVQGRAATILGWHRVAKNEVLHKAAVNILRNEDCSRNLRLITNNIPKSNPRILCSQNQPYALSDHGDSGGPIIDENNKLLGVGYSDCPDPIYAWNDCSIDFLKQYMVNLHFSIDYYRFFIDNVTGYY